MLDTNWNDDFEQQARRQNTPMQDLQPIGATSPPQAQADDAAWSGGSAATGSRTNLGAPSTPAATSPQAQNIVNTLGVAPITPASTPRFTPDYDSAVSAVWSAPDQPSAAAAHDQLARDVTRHLTLEGHDVQPGENGQLIVDGRAYTVAGADSVNGWGATATDTFADNPTGDGDVPPVAPAPPAAPAAPSTPPPAPLTAPPFGSQYAWQQTPEGQALFNRMKQAFPDMSDADIAQHLNYPDMPDPQFFGAITSNIANARRAAAEHAAATTSTSTTTTGSGTWQSITLPMVQQAFQEAGLTGHAARGNMEPIAAWFRAHGYPDAKATGEDGITVGGIFLDMLKAGSDDIWLNAETGVASGAGVGGDAQHWNPTASTGSPYTPSAIATTDPRLEQLGDWLATDPQSLSDRTVAQMETKDAEERQLAAQNQDEAIKRFGYQSGIIDSPWLASERGANARAADEGIIGGRRTIEIEAARTNTADLRSAISSLSQIASSTRDRFALNEQLKLEAARLGMTADQFIQQLMMRMYELQLQQQQYGSDLAYRYDALNEQSDEAFWNATH